MNMNTLRDLMRDAIHDDAAVEAWCEARYDRPCNVYVGIDHRQPPNENAYPLVHVFPVSKGGGYDLTDQQHAFFVTCGVHDATELATDKTNVVEMAGVGYVEAFRKLVETAVVSIDLSAYGIYETGRVEVDYEPVELFPFFLANMIITFTHDYVQGDDPFE